MAKKASIRVGDTFTSKEGEILTVVEYLSATKVLVSWPDGETLLYKSAQQLRNGTASKRTRKTSNGTITEEEVLELKEVQEDWVATQSDLSETEDHSGYIQRINDVVVPNE